MRAMGRVNTARSSVPLGVRGLTTALVRNRVQRAQAPQECDSRIFTMRNTPPQPADRVFPDRLRANVHGR